MSLFAHAVESRSTIFRARNVRMRSTAHLNEVSTNFVSASDACVHIDHSLCLFVHAVEPRSTIACTRDLGLISTPQETHHAEVALQLKIDRNDSSEVRVRLK